MAQRTLLRRIWTLSLRELSSPAVPRPSLSLSPPSLSPLPLSRPSLSPLSSLLPLSRSLSLSAAQRVSFSVQDAADFTDRVLRSAQPVLVDFHAQWCGPCKILGPRLEKMVSKQQGKVTMAKVDIDDHTDLAIEYGVSAVPTVLAIKNGDVVDKFVGIKDEDQLDAFISKLIGS